MVTAEFCLRVFLSAWLVLGTHGLPIKGSKSQDQSGSDTYAEGHSASNWGGAGGNYAPMSYSAAKDVPMAGQAPGPSKLVYANPASGNLLSATYQAGYPVGAGYIPVQAGYPSSAQANPPEMKWAVEPKIFSEEGLANSDALSSNNELRSSLSLPPAPSGPVLQSGETSSVVKEAELGNYQHETEEVGYPADRMGPGQVFASDPLASPVLPQVGLSVYPYPYPLPYPYPQFDYRLIYGLYPPGTYTTFSKNHEKGKDYYQSIHYLKDHGSGPSDSSGSPGSGQQKRVFSQGP
ncbi:uncharacterized protein LOC108242545 [Kryptolebias marmoratus]|uniref:uncharacterized protein LOC108242545 n=1 Tax=Kryptolebias marmoratus TaxID=37003 RepID=UPI0007F90947|nr:uncharacterized protein LOC108242545 [Kryptolebias marmoratus]